MRGEVLTSLVKWSRTYASCMENRHLTSHKPSNTAISFILKCEVGYSIYCLFILLLIYI
jgi:hypothetical protein